MDILSDLSMVSVLVTIQATYTINLVIFGVKLVLGDMIFHGVKKGLRMRTVNDKDKMSDY